MRQLRVAAAALALAAPAAGAQSVFDSEVRFAPQFMQYRLKTPVDETISQLAIPLFVSVPVSSRLTLDVGTSYASTRVTGDGFTSELRGLTDTQLRGNLTLGSDFVVLTAGLNLPTGKSAVTLDEVIAASRIGNDFLAFPIATMGTGFGATGGIAVARPLGEWNVGFGAALRRATSYEPFNIPNTTLRYQPGNEYRARLGADRPVGGGRVAVGLTFSKFGDDNANGVHSRSGNRIIGQTVYTTVMGERTLVLGAYDVFRNAGQFASGAESGRENVANVYATIGVPAMNRVLEPTIELRHWLQDVPAFVSGSTTVPARSQSSVLGTLGLRTRLDVAGVTMFPSVGYTMGRLATTDGAAPTHAGMTGFRAQIGMRVAPFTGP